MSMLVNSYLVTPGFVQPTHISSTGYTSAASDSTSWTPFTGLDLSGCDMAVFICSSDGNQTIGTSSGGWNAEATNAGSSVSTRIFYKVGPTASETLTLTTTAGEQFSGILIQIADGANISGSVFNSGASASANGDPPSHDAGMVRPHLWIACGGWDGSGTINVTAAPSGYSNLTTAAKSGAGGVYTASATLEATSQTEDPGAFTSSLEQHATSTLAVWS